MSQTDLVIHVPMVLQVLGILVELLAVHAAYGIYDQVVMQVARIDMCCHQYFKIGNSFSASSTPMALAICGDK